MISVSAEDNTKVALNGTDKDLYYALVKVLTVPNGVYIAPNGVIRIKKD